MSELAILNIKLKEEQEYWISRLSGEIENSNLPLDFKRSRVYSRKQQTVVFELPPELAQRLIAFTNNSSFLIYTTLMASLKICLHKYTGSAAVVVGSPAHRKEGQATRENNALPILDIVSDDIPFRQFLMNVRETLTEAYARQSYPFRQIITDLGIEEEPNRCPLFDIILMLEDIHDEPPELRNDITLRFNRSGDGLTGVIHFNARLFRYEKVERFAGHMINVLRGALSNTAAPVSILTLMDEAERDRLFEDWNNINEEYQSDICLDEMFERQVERTPDAVALIHEEKHLTYRELNDRANRVAHSLLRLGFRPEAIGGLCADRSPEMIIGLLAIVKAGGAYLPLDPAHPESRLAFMLKDAGAPVVLTLRRHAEKFSTSSSTVICLDSDWEKIAAESRDNPSTGVTPDNPAYLLYTSGSTGQPKGVAMPGRPLVNLISWQLENAKRPDLKTLQFASLSFDVSFQEIFSTLSGGGALVLISEDLRRDPPGLWALLADEAVERLFLPFIYLQQMADAAVGRVTLAHQLREIITAGEQLQVTPSVVELFRRLPECSLSNQYGPTEAHVVSAFTLDGPASRWPTLPPIGRPIANARIYLLDRNLDPVPAGVAGELYLGGVSLARCYLNRPEMSAEKFIPHPFSPEGGARLYKTGDLGRYLPDGQIEYLGRLDHQVKIRGFRVEIGEIEVALSRHPAISECAVIVREDVPGDKRLAAYSVTSHGQPPSSGDLRRFLKERLPEYMVPSAFVFLDSLPLTRTGKIDRRALQALTVAAPETAAVSVQPRTPVEELLAQIWVEVLGVKNVGIYDNFFELGGDSILTIQVVARANRAGLRLIPKQLFEHQTIAGLAAVADTTVGIQSEQGVVSGTVPLTPIQHWFFDQNTPTPSHFNMGYLFEWRGDEAPDPSLVEQSVRILLSHHDALRLRFVNGEGGWRQVNASAEEAAFFSHADLSGYGEADQTRAIETAATALQSSLSLTDGPLIRAALFDLGKERAHRLLIIIHHVAVDGVSWRILVEDFQTVYRRLQKGEAVNLPPKTTSFRQWAERLNQHAQSEAITRELNYWMAESHPPFTPLPVDNPDGGNLESSAEIAIVSLSAEDTESLLRAVPKFHNLRINDVLLTALARAFSRWTDARSLLIELEGHGREEIAEDLDISRTVGWFTSISPVWLDLRQADTPGEALTAVKEQLGRIPNRGIGYGLLRYLNDDPATAEKLRSMPRAQVSFNYLGQTGQMFNEASLLKAMVEPIGPVIAPDSPMPHLIYVAGIIFESQLYMRFKYSKDRYHASTMEALAQAFREELGGLIAYCQSAEAADETAPLFTLAHVDREELAMALQQVGTDDGERRMTAAQVEDVYPLSPSQEGILFHSIYAPQSGVYVIQMHCTFRSLDVSATEQAWQALLERYPILRSAFAWENVARPLQIVARGLKMPWQRLDWRGLSPDVVQERFQAYLEEDRNRGFNLSTAPLMRFSLIRTGENDYKFVWSHHHLLLDGWSIFIVLKEFCILYDAFVKGEVPQLTPTQSYGDYIAWVRERDPKQAEPFWREMLAGFREPTPVGRQIDGEAGHSVRYGEHRGVLSEASMSALQAFARQQQLTVNTVVQAAWAMLLSHYSGTKDVVFGATASGRPSELAGIESMVGIFINVLPMRIKLDSGEPVTRWLKKIQERQFKVRQYEYSPLVQIQRWSDVPRGKPLFQSILSFENYPIDSSISQYASNLDISDVVSSSRTNYPITAIVAPRKEMAFRFVYDRGRLDQATVEEMAGHFEAILQAFVAHPESSVGAVEEMLSENERNRRALDQRKQEDAKRNRFKKIKPKAVSLPQELVKLDYLTEKKFPLVIEPAIDNVNVADWVAHNRQFVEKELYRHGAVLFRGFKVDGVDKFQQAATAICPELFGEYGDLPREGVNGKVYGSTPYPSTQTILYHNESSHMHRWPLKIWFYCVQAALEGGETPIADCRELYRQLDPQIRERFARKKLMYVRNYLEGLDVSWQSFFRTKDKSEVEEYCRNAGIDFTWTDGDGLRTRKVCVAVAKHPRTEEMVFFNQVQLHHASCLDPAVRETLDTMFSEPEFPRNVYYGDGSPIEDSIIAEISELYRQTSVSFRWRERDILMLDNMLVAHARNPYEGPRRIVVAMGELFTEAELEAS